ncbi:hypothetical protein Gotur_011066 [Gossypium turneri]
MLSICTPDMHFVYILLGWEGSIIDGRVLRDAIRYQPRTLQEFFNMKHASTHNIIQRYFGLLKHRWGIIRSPSFYPVRVHNRIIIACC